MSPPRAVDLPIKMQVLVLTLAAILVAQAMIVVVVLLLPPPRFQPYFVDDIAAVLKTPTLGESFDRPISVRESAVPPEDPGASDPRDYRLRAALAARLGVANEAVRLHSRPRSGGLLRGPSPVGGPRVSREWRMGGRGGPVLDPRRDVESTPVLEFVAAWRQPDGGWRVAAPVPTHDWLKRLLVWVVAGMAVMGPVAWWFADKITGPVRSFAAAAEALGRDPTAAAFVKEGPAEIGVAARAFNAMQTRLARYVVDRMGIMGAISHDLRTPLTRIRFKVEQVAEPSRSEVLWEVQHMEAMIDLVLAFIRDVDHAAPRERLDLGSLVAAAADDAAALGRPVEMDQADDVEELLLVDASPVALRNVVDNLIDNALKYGGRARLRLLRRGDEAVVAIQDPGPGIPADQAERVFTPFYRLAPTDGSIPGVGLGLTTARSIVRGLGGEVTLNSSDAWFAVEISLPLAINP